MILSQFLENFGVWNQKKKKKDVNLNIFPNMQLFILSFNLS